MRRLRMALLCGSLAAASVFAQTGDYLGTLQAGATQLRIALHVIKDSNGALKGDIDSLDQGAHGLPVQLTVEGKSIRFGSGFGMSYEGTISADGITIQGFATQSGNKMQLDFKKVDRIEAAKRPQTPQRPFAYVEEEIAIQNGAVRLGGTLSFPKASGPFPAVIFLTGSGAQDRDETLFEHKPFLVISDMLVRMGVATLRMDDRGVGRSTGNLSGSNIDDLARDGAAMLEFLKSRKEINGARIGYLGHSEGGITGPVAAVRFGGAAFVIMLAGTGVPGDELLYEQAASLQKAMGVPEQSRALQSKLQRRFLPLVKSIRDQEDLKKRVTEEWTKFKEEEPLAKLAEQQIWPQLQQMWSPALAGLIRHDPAPVLAQLQCPVLALNGTLDTQVPYYQNLPAITAALSKTSHPDFTVVALPHLNHLFQLAKSGAPSEYGQIEETISPRVLDLIAQWLKARI